MIASLLGLLSSSDFKPISTSHWPQTSPEKTNVKNRALFKIRTPRITKLEEVFLNLFFGRNSIYWKYFFIVLRNGFVITRAWDRRGKWGNGDAPRPCEGCYRLSRQNEVALFLWHATVSRWSSIDNTNNAHSNCAVSYDGTLLRHG